MKKHLIVVSHPDDEVLGAGGTIYKLYKLGIEVYVCILCGEVEVRQFRPHDSELDSDLENANKILGVKKVIKGEFPNIKMNVVPHLEIVKFIENIIEKYKIEVVITHHPSDLNNDHYQTSIACQAAVRLYQRRENVYPLKEFLYMEVPSATEWGLNKSLNQFNPNVFIEIEEEGLSKKIESLSNYRGVMRDYPHPRSVEALRGLAAYRGSQSGQNYSEAFESVFRRGF
ncbi:PIG-L deacetylase family protein [Cetobacterium sp.]|uniref:PIG-L deacetylase family protein n=1 Tax=Cetobacterium sp. TaxID=2071632 RepID=UPI003F2D4EB4